MIETADAAGLDGRVDEKGGIVAQATDVAFDGRGSRQSGTGARFAFCIAVSLFATPVFAQDAAPGGRPSGTGPALKLELNRLEPAGDNCRTYLLADNSRGPALKSLKVDLFAFDTDGVAQKRLAVELGPIPERKTVVRLFDFPQIACPKIGRVLLNDVLTCEGGEASRENCLERIETTSKTGSDFAR